MTQPPKLDYQTPENSPTPSGPKYPYLNTMVAVLYFAVGLLSLAGAAVAVSRVLVAAAVACLAVSAAGFWLGSQALKGKLYGW
ncbi:MAG: hypothetical protein ABR964_01170 [Tepidisphaeraceae bacterium]